MDQDYIAALEARIVDLERENAALRERGEWTALRALGHVLDTWAMGADDRRVEWLDFYTVPPPAVHRAHLVEGGVVQWVAGWSEPGHLTLKRPGSNAEGATTLDSLASGIGVHWAVVAGIPSADRAERLLGQVSAKHGPVVVALAGEQWRVVAQEGGAVLGVGHTPTLALLMAERRGQAPSSP